MDLTNILETGRMLKQTVSLASVMEGAVETEDEFFLKKYGEHKPKKRSEKVRYNPIKSLMGKFIATITIIRSA